MAVCISASKQNFYQHRAIEDFSWQNHSHSDRVKAINLTISPTVQAVLRNVGDTQVGITLNFLGPIAGFNKVPSPVSNCHSQGPYIDTICYSLKPTQESFSCIHDSAKGTPIKNIVTTFQNSDSYAIGASPGATPLSMSSVLPNGSGTLNFTHTSSKSQQTVSEEYKTVENLDFYKKPLTCSMTKCWSGEISMPYDTNQIGTLRHSKLNTRIGMGFVPFFGWFGGWHCYPDQVYTLRGLLKSERSSPLTVMELPIPPIAMKA